MVFFDKAPAGLPVCQMVWKLFGPLGSTGKNEWLTRSLVKNTVFSVLIRGPDDDTERTLNKFMDTKLRSGCHEDWQNLIQRDLDKFED